MHSHLTRRDILAGMAGSSIAATAAVSVAAAQPAAEPARPRDPFMYCLNTSTIRGQNLPITEEVDIAARAGYQAIEPWINELERYVQQGGNLRDLARRIRDAGLVVPSAIGFMDWVVDDETRRRRGLEVARRAMDMVQQIGGRRLAAPPVGATDQTDLNLMRAAERYRALLEVGARIGVVPQCEVWGFSKALGRLGECVMVAVETGHPQACVLADVYHLHKGGSGFAGLHLLSGDALQIFHMNDYPAEPGRDAITDAHRVYPGDGVAPLRQMIRDLRRVGFQGVLSLELFNRDYWRQDALAVARTGLDKMRTVVRGSLEG
ncbi:MAG TPA: sugar phosphate isomerase/epimerase family protein [Gemmataceae bacterium]|jgi:sugar phosphate isomerase/epimerase|nr:sugar phosphate isomerase/epimerase family protein [Gemmataceae bacterium]